MAAADNKVGNLISHDDGKESQRNGIAVKFIQSPECLRNSIKPNDGQEMNFSHENPNDREESKIFNDISTPLGTSFRL